MTKQKHTNEKKISNLKKEKNSQKTQHKNQEKKNVNIQTQAKEKHNATDEVTKLVEVILIVLVIFAAFYIITYWIKKSETKKDILPQESENVMIQYDEILMGRLLEQKNSEYYVLIIDEEDKTNYQAYLSSYNEKENALRFYTAKLDSAFNRKYKAESSKLDTQNIKEIKVKETTLVYIKDKKIENHWEGVTSILGKLGELIK